MVNYWWKYYCQKSCVSCKKEEILSKCHTSLFWRKLSRKISVRVISLYTGLEQIIYILFKQLLQETLISASSNSTGRKSRSKTLMFIYALISSISLFLQVFFEKLPYLGCFDSGSWETLTIFSSHILLYNALVIVLKIENYFSSIFLIKRYNKFAISSNTFYNTLISETTFSLNLILKDIWSVFHDKWWLIFIDIKIRIIPQLCCAIIKRRKDQRQNYIYWSCNNDRTSFSTKY